MSKEETGPLPHPDEAIALHRKYLGMNHRLKSGLKRQPTGWNTKGNWAPACSLHPPVRIHFKTSFPVSSVYLLFVFFSCSFPDTSGRAVPFVTVVVHSEFFGSISITDAINQRSCIRLYRIAGNSRRLPFLLHTNAICPLPSFLFPHSSFLIPHSSFLFTILPIYSRE